jgi:hypothetical protein
MSADTWDIEFYSCDPNLNGNMGNVPDLLFTAQIALASKGSARYMRAEFDCDRHGAARRLAIAGGVLDFDIKGSNPRLSGGQISSAAMSSRV